MGDVSFERRFAGQARLVRLLLWKVGDTTDIDACLAAALDAGMITADDETFLRACLEAEERQRESTEAGRSASSHPAGRDASEGSGPDGSARAASLVPDDGVIARLRRCADKLNRADSA